MSIVKFPAPTAQQTRQHDNVTIALIKSGVNPETARIVSEAVTKRLAAALEGPDVLVRFSTAMSPVDVAQQLDTFAVALATPLLAEIVKLEVQLHRANEALAAAMAKDGSKLDQPRNAGLKLPLTP